MDNKIPMNEPTNSTGTGGFPVPIVGKPPPTVTTSIDPFTVDVRGVAALLGIGRSMVIKLNNSGRLPLPIKFGRCVRWRKAELAAWVSAGCPTRDRWRWK